MKTKITELLGIKYPIIQGGMAWTSEACLASAVSNAGGAGIIACGGRTAEWVREDIRKAKTLTDKTFGVNVMLMAPNVDEIVDVICEEKPAFVTLGAGNPVPFIKKFQDAGIKVIPVVPNVKLAQRIAAAGADAMVIEGMEAGGHIGKQTTMALMENVLPNVKDVPVYETFSGWKEETWENYKPVPWKELVPRLDANGIDLLKKLLCYDPEKRISAADALEHPFFKDLDEQTLSLYK
jgi:enoyl-[acyl-carrier protein] reductase II